MNLENKFTPPQERLFQVIVQLMVRRGLDSQEIAGLEQDAAQLGFVLESDEVIIATQRARAYLNKEEPDSSW